jgi:hypothetical protein
LLLGSFVNKPHAEDELKEIVRLAVFVFSRQFVIICHQVSDLEAISNTSFNRR